jgi:hypothetical protein
MNDQTPTAESRDDMPEAGPLYAQVLTSTRQLLAPGQSVPMDEIGRHAWAHLSEQDRADAIPNLMTSYATRVHDEEAERSRARDAADPEVTTYLADGDMALLWDAYLDSTAEQASVGRRALLNVLSEVELLRHRLDMARDTTTRD